VTRILALFLLLVLAGPAPAGELDVAALDALIARTVEEKNLVGLSAGILYEGRVVLAKGYGDRSLEPTAPVTEETLFAIGSVTKQFTCAALFLLAEDGKLSERDRVARFAPDLTRAGDVSLLDLGQHVAGYPDYYPLDFVDRAMARSRPPEEIVREFAGRPLDFEPGTRWSYSNTGYLILGIAIERASGLSFGAFLEKRILAPLGMTRTRYEPKRGEDGLSTGYTPFMLGEPTVAVPEGEGWIGAAGGLWSTPSDLLAWELALMDGKLLAPASWSAMTAPRRLADGRSTKYGCGLSVRDDGAALVLSHGGAVSGFNARNTLVPATRSAVVLLANVDTAGSAFDAIMDAVLPKLMPPPNEGNAPAIAGLPALDAAMRLMRGLQSGDVDRVLLGEEFSAYLTPERLLAAKASLSPLGAAKSAKIARTSERGGMEVTRVEFTFERETVAASMYRSPDGLVQQFLVYRS